jgi:cytochrome c oxidase subunit 2
MKTSPLQSIRHLDWIGAIATGAAGCTRAQSVLGPAGAHASVINALWWRNFYLDTAVYVLVLIFLLGAVIRARRGQTDTAAAAVEQPSPATERRLGLVVGSAMGATVIALFFLLFASVLTTRRLSAVTAPDALTLQIIGHQWWWEVRYEDPQVSNQFTTANEIHIPVGRPVLLRLDSRDVIHSFWIPSLNGKKDLIPGRPTSLWIEASKPGTFFGQCAEFCGYQHAHMRLQVVAETPEQFDAWLNAQRQNAAPPSTETQKRGQQVFLTTTCAMCHTIDGTTARSGVGPNLTHLASRTTIGAGVWPNTPDHLASWIRDPQTPKPGARMPANPFTPDDLQALVDYLQNLK